MRMLIAAAFALTPLGAHAQEVGEAALATTVDSATAKIIAKEFDAASVLLEPAIAEFEAALLPAGKRVFCARSGPETLAYMGMAATAKEEAVALGTDYCQAIFLRAYLLTEAGRHDLAIETLSRLRELAPFNAQYFAELAFNMRSAGELDESLSLYEQARDAASWSPNDGDEKPWRAVALRGIGWIQIEKGQWDDAEKTFRESLENEPDNEMALSELDFIERNNRDNSES